MKDRITVDLADGGDYQKLTEKLVRAALLFANRPVEIRVIWGFDSPEAITIQDVDFIDLNPFYARE